MPFLGIDQHARQLKISLRQNGDVILARQVSTQPVRPTLMSRLREFELNDSAASSLS